MVYGMLKNYKADPKSEYINYNDPNQLDSLDITTIRNPNNISVFPELIPSGDPVQTPYYTCFRPRSTKTQYIKDVEVFKHPQHFSRYGYARCFNGYCSGHFPGRYIVPDDCDDCEQPYDTAPARFYR